MIVAPLVNVNVPVSVSPALLTFSASPAARADASSAKPLVKEDGRSNIASLSTTTATGIGGIDGTFVNAP